jgi:hypothetical protein
VCLDRRRPLVQPPLRTATLALAPRAGRARPAPTASCATATALPAAEPARCSRLEMSPHDLVTTATLTRLTPADVSGGVFLLRGEDDLVPMTEAPYDSEDVLQELLAKFLISSLAISLAALRHDVGC